MQFMEQTSPAEFTEKWMAAKTSKESEQDEATDQNELGTLAEMKLPPHNQVAA